MTREKSAYYVAIYGLPQGVETGIQGGSQRFETQSELNIWIKENGVIEHPNKDPSIGILPDGRAIQIFHGHTESLVTKVEIG